MNRAEIKNLAKEKIKGNLLNLLWPIIVISIVGSIPSMIVGDSESILALIIVLAASFVTSIFSVSYVAYLLEFVRTGTSTFNTIIECVKKNWLRILLVSILVGVFTFLWTLLFIIPGIVAALSYSMATYLIVDTDLDANDAIKESKRMMKGYKWDYFVFGLSFIGWIILVPLTFGILYIWLLPYMYVSMAIYYEKLKAKANGKIENATNVVAQPEAVVAEEK